jgi:transposase
MPASSRVLSCYEAGRDGFWLHRHLVSVGIENEVVDAASIEVSRRLRHVKTDRLDGDRLLAKLIRHHAGERGGWSVVRVPSVEEEDARHLHRELERLKRERLAHRVRMQSLLKAELERERERLALVERQIERLEAARRERLSAPRTDASRPCRELGAVAACFGSLSGAFSRNRPCLRLQGRRQAALWQKPRDAGLARPPERAQSGSACGGTTARPLRAATS